MQRQFVKKLKISFEDRLNDNHSPIGIRNNKQNGLVFSQSDGQVLLQVGYFITSSPNCTKPLPAGFLQY